MVYSWSLSDREVIMPLLTPLDRRRGLQRAVRPATD